MINEVGDSAPKNGNREQVASRYGRRRIAREEFSGMSGGSRRDSDPGYSLRIGKLSAAHVPAKPYKELSVPTPLQHEEERLSSLKLSEQLRSRAPILKRRPVERVGFVLRV
jgi:hypothetical protein